MSYSFNSESENNFNFSYINQKLLFDSPKEFRKQIESKTYDLLGFTSYTWKSIFKYCALCIFCYFLFGVFLIDWLDSKFISTNKFHIFAALSLLTTVFYFTRVGKPKAWFALSKDGIYTFQKGFHYVSREGIKRNHLFFIDWKDLNSDIKIYNTSPKKSLVINFPTLTFNTPYVSESSGMTPCVNTVLKKRTVNFKTQSELFRYIDFMGIENIEKVEEVCKYYLHES